ncbi:MAG: Flp family type IVb pilin [Actinobacteria bacterium]|nr:Flp family type IVb pilin [Actinomycetota bacterium]
MNFIRKVYLKVHTRKYAGDTGSTLIEIALYIALVVIVCIAVVSALGGKLQSVFQSIVDSL